MRSFVVGTAEPHRQSLTTTQNVRRWYRAVDLRVLGSRLGPGLTNQIPMAWVPKASCRVSAGG